MNKIISGGQSGVDLAALKAAKRFGIPSGGWMPAGYRTEDGPKPEYSILYGMKEHTSPYYPPRTERNICESDATVWLGFEDSTGFTCTMRAARRYGRPFKAINYLFGECEEYDVFTLINYICENNIKILNVAGSRGSMMKDRGKWAYDYLCEVFGALGFKDSLS